ncbi:response regulator [Pueribacillus theae]|uniref:response regulator n=1 Tax=Pueribacillus theae TaxID=2171751 RepID=UPI001F0C380A|nr:response regulator [Pueribacillus theae]
MRAILVDDEPLILAHFEKIVKDIHGIEIIGVFINPNEALTAILQTKPDVVFLDIEMPELNGLEVAEQIQSSFPQTNIVFITAYSDYAVKAFELNAVDYLLKPVRHERLVETIRRLNKSNTHPKAPTRAPMICCFQSLQFKWSNDLSQKLDVRWRTNKARELFAFLVHYRQKPVRKDMILDLFWPDTDWDKGFTQLYTAIYQIRKTLGSINFDIRITSHENSYMLDLNEVKVDVDEWEKGINECSSVTRDTLPVHQKLIDLFQGDYLAENDFIWAENERERLRTLWLNHVTKVSKFLVANGEYAKAVELYDRIQKRHPHVEDSYFMLMQLYDRLGERYYVEQQYEKLTKMLADEFSVRPRQEVQIWHRNWKKNLR